MSEQSDRLARHIDQQGSEVRDNLLELKQRATRSVDWRAQCEEHPLAMVGIAAGGGMLLSFLIGGRTRSNSAFSPESAHEYSERASGGTLDALKAVAVGIAVTKLKAFVEELLPGAQEEYRKAKAGY